ncbi:DUF4097 family beta strand repeat-containing protein [Albibacterium indicum]|uniref:DUF4097 family beta strand repeat-containing protein n=1 Tax=Albibacterium indicum TaxID=2292082 RepID=UPI000E532FF2|nr:agmatine deiminase family protein [Pedobacter indicus]
MNTIAKQRIIGFVLLVVSSTAFAFNTMNDAVLMATKKFSSSQVKNLTINTSGGSIEVDGNGGSETTVEMHVRPNNNRNLSKSEIQEILDRDYEISIAQKGNTVEAFAKRKNQGNWRNALNISFRVKTGKNVASNLKTSGGSIHIANLDGHQNFKTSGGGLTVSNIRGNIDGQTSGGSIKANNLDGDIHLSTSGGSIRLDNLSGNIDVKTSGGSIKGDRIDGALHASTSGGSIDLGSLTCVLDASTSGGSVTASLMKLPGDVNLSTSAGSVNLTIPRNAAADLNLKGMRVNANNLNNFKGTNSKGKLIGSMNGGGKQISASTSAGSVNLRVN